MNKTTNSKEETSHRMQSIYSHDHSRVMRRLKGILDLSHRQMAAVLGMSSQELTLMERQNIWTNWQLEIISEKLNIPLAGLDYLATESEPIIYFVVQNNTLGDGGTIGFTNYKNISNYDNSEKMELLVTKFEKIINKLILKIDLLEKRYK